MKVRAQSMKVRPVRWNPFPVEHIGTLTIDYGNAETELHVHWHRE